jgi:hypothetical protein
MSKWAGGLAEWQEGDTTYLSVAFTYKLDEAYSRAVFARACGQKIIVGGPALFLVKMQHILADVAEIRQDYPDAISKHNPLATFASRGCPVGCWFCIVPKMEGKEFTLLPEFPVRPILCDNNLSALPAEYQDYIIERYQGEGVKLIDANSGFEPITFTEEVYRRWKPLLNAGGGPWRFAFDETKEGPQVRQVMRMLAEEPQKRKRVYVLVGNEPYAECMARIREVIAAGCEPHVQPYLKLNAMDREPVARHDWTVQRLKDVARWANGFVWKRAPFEEYDRHRKSSREEKYDEQEGLFV